MPWKTIYDLEVALTFWYTVVNHLSYGSILAFSIPWQIILYPNVKPSNILSASTKINISLASNYNYLRSGEKGYFKNRIFRESKLFSSKLLSFNSFDWKDRKVIETSQIIQKLKKISSVSLIASCELGMMT